MFVACSTLCFSREPLESALRHIAELEFDKIDLAIVEGGPHLRPSRGGREPRGGRCTGVRHGPSLTPSALDLDFGDVDPQALPPQRFEAMCRLAKPLTVAVLTIPAAPLGTPFDDEVAPARDAGRVRRARGPGPDRRDPLRDPDRRPGRRRRALQGRARAWA